MTGNPSNWTSLAKRRGRLALVFAATLGLAACGGEMSDLQNFVAQEKAKPPGPIEPLPQVKPYEGYVYRAEDLRSPFVPDFQASVAQSGESGGPCPDPNRNAEYLETFPLDGLRMVGTLTLAGEQYALVQDPDSAVHRIQEGNYLGQNFGRVTSISEYEMSVLEIVPDGLGGCMERQAGLAIAE